MSRIDTLSDALKESLGTSWSWGEVGIPIISYNPPEKEIPETKTIPSHINLPFWLDWAEIEDDLTHAFISSYGLEYDLINTLSLVSSFFPKKPKVKIQYIAQEEQSGFDYLRVYAYDFQNKSDLGKNVASKLIIFNEELVKILSPKALPLIVFSMGY